MDFLSINSPVENRVEIRNQARNLDSFLGFNFGGDKKLTLIDDKVHGHAIKCLNVIDTQHISWKTYPSLWWNNSLSLRKISHYITATLPDWEKSLQQEDKKLVKLELQCARLEKVVAKHNLKAKTANSKEDPIAFVNPFNKKLKLNLSYPAIIGSSTRTTVIREVFFDRLTTAAELAARVKEALDKPILVQVFGSNLDKGDLVSIPLTVIPKTLFKTITQAPQILFDPTDDQVRENNQVIHVSYGDYDDRALASLHFSAGEKQSLPNVYDQGFLAGKIAGFNDALIKMKKVFSGQ